MEAIVRLIHYGANVFTTDNCGRSIFDDAYDCDHDDWRPLGAYRGDLWDAVLAQCGYENCIRTPEQRMCHYTEWYGREDFERLWKGREHLCPYFSGLSEHCPLYEVPSESGTKNRLYKLEPSEDKKDNVAMSEREDEA